MNCARASLVLIALLVVWRGDAALAQVAGPPPSALLVRAHDTIKVWSATPRLRGKRGTVTQPLSDSLYFAAPAGFRQRIQTTGVPVASVTRIDVLQGRRRSALRVVGGMLFGGVVGAAGGGVAGALIFRGIESTQKHDEDFLGDPDGPGTGQHSLAPPLARRLAAP